MAGRNAAQRKVEQRLIQQSPKHKRRLQAVFALPALFDDGRVTAVINGRQRVGKERRPAAGKLRVVQISRPALKGVKKGAGQGREKGIPAEQPKQAADQTVLNKKHRRLRLRKVFSNRVLHTQRGWPGKSQQPSRRIRLWLRGWQRLR